MKFGLGADELRSILDQARNSVAWQERHAQGTKFDIVLTPEPPLRLGGVADVDRARAAVRTYESIGATAPNIRFVHDSFAHFREALHRFSETVIADRG